MERNDPMAHPTDSLAFPDKCSTGKPELIPKRPELKARVTMQYRDDPDLTRGLISIILLALEIADMDKEEAAKYQKSAFENL